MDRLIARTAAPYGVIDRKALIRIGLGRGQIDYRLRIGRLIQLHRGVYAVGVPSTDWRARCLAAVLAVGADAVLSHRTAAALQKLLPHRGPLHVTAPRKVRPPRGVVCHLRRLPADERTIVDGIPVTSLARTLLDLAAGEGRGPLARALREAEYLRLTHSLSLPGLIARCPAHRGTAIAADLLGDPLPPLRTRSELEDRFLVFLEERRLPRPEVNVTLEARGRRLEVDCLWREQRLIAELDGRAAHGPDHAYETDRERDALLQSVGWRVVRVTWRRLHRDPAGVESILRALLTG